MENICLKFYLIAKLCFRYNLRWGYLIFGSPYLKCYNEKGRRAISRGNTGTSLWVIRSRTNIIQLRLFIFYCANTKIIFYVNLHRSVYIQTQNPSGKNLSLEIPKTSIIRQLKYCHMFEMFCISHKCLPLTGDYPHCVFPYGLVNSPPFIKHPHHLWGDGWGTDALERENPLNKAENYVKHT